MNAPHLRYSISWRERIAGLSQQVPLADGRLAPYINLDNAATTPPLQEVLDAVYEFLPYYSSVHRGAGFKSRVSTAAYDRTPVAEHGEGLRALEEGRLDAYASDRILLAGLLATAKNPAKLRLSGEFFSYEPYGLMMRRGDNAFQARVNRTLSTLYRSGLVQIYEKWFGPFAGASPLVKALYLLHSWPD